MTQRSIKFLFLYIFLLCPFLFFACSGKTASKTLSNESLSEGLKELYDSEALLNKADGLFKDKDYIGATKEYQRFLELHPLHKSASYAQYRIGLSYFKQLRSIDRDIEPVQKALLAFETELKDYPGNEYADDVTAKIRMCREKLAEREFYIGNFYLKKEIYPAAIGRFRNILTEYSDTVVVQKAIYYLGIAYSSSGESDKAVETLHNLLDMYPDTSYKKDADNILARLNNH